MSMRNRRGLVALVAIIVSAGLAGCTNSPLIPAPTVTVTAAPTPSPAVTGATVWTPAALAAACVAALNDQTPSADFKPSANSYYQISPGALSDYSVEVYGTAAVGGSPQDCQISGPVADPKIEIGLGADGS